MKQNADQRHPFLLELGQRVRSQRSLRGMTRKQLGVVARVSERHLANLEGGTGNISVLILLDIARALGVPVVQLFESALQSSPPLSSPLAQVSAASTTLGKDQVKRIALIGLRGAGKSTLGAALAQELGYRLIEISREIETLADASLHEVYDLYGEAGYRRFERQALKVICESKEPSVIAVPGGIVSSADTYELLLRHCTVIWLKANPIEHMSRVRAQGDNRPMAATRVTHRPAIDDLKMILQRREAQYAMAHHTLDTSGLDVATSNRELLELVKRL
jgi:XRE family transcriptional regulator, aerobic/anaerobic benzoate catabolism transcriptional regulator